MNCNKSILFVSEDITLAQVVRLKVLADSLKNLPIDIHFASSSFPKMIFAECTFNCIQLSNVGALAAKLAVKNCDQLYNEFILEKYIADDIALIKKEKPDLIVADFRLSLSISAEIMKIPLAIIINAYWSPYYRREAFPMPDHPWETLLGLPLMNAFYPIARPFAFKSFVKPFNILRKKYGLPSISGLPELLTYGNYVLYPDI